MCAGPPTKFYFIADGSRTATRIGTGYAGDGIASGSSPGTVWLVTYPSTRTLLTSSSYAQLMSTAGSPLGPRYRLPANTLMGRGAGNYLLLVLDTGTESQSELWDPKTGRVLSRLAVLNTATGSVTRIPGTALSSADFENIGWQNGGHRLIIIAGPQSEPGADQIAYWQPGMTHLNTVTIGYTATTRNLHEIAAIETGLVG
jgi:hypothetical protein